MKITDWNIIFKLKDFGEYLCNNDLLRLSMSSKSVRSYLSQNTLKSLNFSHFVDDRGYDSAVSMKKTCRYQELTRSKIKFAQELKLFNGNPSKLIVNDSREYYYLLYEIPRIFPIITTLVLNNSVFTMEVLQYLLNYDSLENFELTNNVIFYDKEFSYEYTINYPASLRSLKLRYNQCIEVHDANDTIDKTKVKHSKWGQFEFYADPKYLPNLTSFEYYMPKDRLYEGEDLIEFIKLNPQLKKLKFSGVEFNYELFNIIRDYENLTHLEMNFGYIFYNLINYEIPILYNIKHLCLQLDGIDVDDMIRDKFPNIEELVIEFDGGVTNEINRLIESFSNLKSLKFITNGESKDAKNLTLPELNNLEKFEINFNYEEGKFNLLNLNVKYCKRLRIITFTKNTSYSPFENSETNQKLIKNCEYLYFPHKLTFRKNT
ncbi:hypothetical protein CONCODRAFT_11936 [Conidiobolus coronatus NRRL 28638]|uniref:F-box domain-containing protein n=1 Tax=Conidiobolus coronatus (strain ATCC 28846 / CBS 209.66 / NRRL 28638) TaxID=796925 RepID=A0A137NU46_CONC2|nr:hypothetical protein CONCODRAFT_11936 [Conidiobolus coronatus NRRL 28638]|eukprot:KXN66269.1 hypothetical protein CONCODRAFT_11936 [Conidiobolus coronatus NRRL 28638]